MLITSSQAVFFLGSNHISLALESIIDLWAILMLLKLVNQQTFFFYGMILLQVIFHSLLALYKQARHYFRQVKHFQSGSTMGCHRWTTLNPTCYQSHLGQVQVLEPFDNEPQIRSLLNYNWGCSLRLNQ